MDVDAFCRFTLKQRNANGESETLEVTVYDYFVNHRHINLRYSADFPCINVGKPKKPTYIPIEVYGELYEEQVAASVKLVAVHLCFDISLCSFALWCPCNVIQKL